MAAVEVGWVQEGLASWWGEEEHGGPTASGERCDMNTMTAAHRELPFGTIVEVENLRNGKKAVVRINDRGPYKEGRVIDVSYAAAKALSMVRSGVVPVKVVVLKAPEPRRRPVS